MSTSVPAPRPREIVATIPAYVPGRPPVPRPGEQVYKLSSNENPYPPLPGVLEAVASAAATMNRYPDAAATPVREALADRLGVGIDQLAAGTGSVGLLYHLLQAYCAAGDEVVYAWRSFEAYPIATTVTGATGVRVPLTEDGRHDLPAMLAAITPRTRAVLICTPNNPTGPAVRRTDLVAFLDAVPADVLVVVDEAYREFVRDDDPVDGVALITDRPNVVVLRTFAKAYGLAGLRVGYLVAHADVAEAVRACALPFAVSGVAQAAAIASLHATDALLERVDRLVVERARVLAALRGQGWPVPDPQGNFVWLGLGDRTAAFSAAAEDAGVMVRPFAGEGVRITVAEPEANDRLLMVAASTVS